MATAFKLGTAARNAGCDAIVDLIDGGTGAGRLEVRSGSPPTNVGDASSGTLLATLTFPATAFGSASTGVATSAANIVSDTNAVGGTAGYFRVYAGAAADTAALFQGSAGDSGDTPDLEFDNKVIVTGGTVAIGDGDITFTVPIGP